MDKKITSKGGFLTGIGVFLAIISGAFINTNMSKIVYLSMAGVGLLIAVCGVILIAKSKNNN